MDDTVRIRCKRCNAVFRDKARRVQSGYSRQCISCEVMIFFDEMSTDLSVRTALKDAHAVRKALLAEEVEKAAQRSRMQFQRRPPNIVDSEQI